MASQYEFQELDRQLTLLERKLEKFEDSIQSTVTPINNAKFNESEYGQRAIERRIDSILSDSKNRITRTYENYINGVRRATHNSLETIKNEARNITEHIESLNNALLSLNELNKNFAEKRYRSVIEKANSIPKTHFDQDICEYITFLQLESYDTICENNLSEFTIDKYSEFKRYYSLCLNNNAAKHLLNARKLLLEASNIIIAKELTHDISELYLVCKCGLKLIGELKESELATYDTYRVRFYEKGLLAFNELSKKAYESFDYAQVKLLLSDSTLFKSDDINIEFFKDGESSPQKLFAYLKHHGHHATAQALDAVFYDTKFLANGQKQKEYFTYWLSEYDRDGIKYIKNLLEIQSSKYEMFSLFCESFYDCKASVQKIGSCFVDVAKLYESYLMENKDNIAFYKFLLTAVSWDKLINTLRSVRNKTENDNLSAGIKIIDSISYSMIVKHKKICANCEKRLIDELNAVVDNASKRLIGKPFSKNLKRADIPNDEYRTITVKLVTIETQKKKKKIILLGTLGAAIVAVGIILLIVFLM